MFVKQREKAVGVGSSEKVVPVEVRLRVHVFTACDAKDQFVFGLVHFVKKSFSRKDAKRCRVAGGLPLRLSAFARENSYPPSSALSTTPHTVHSAPATDDDSLTQRSFHDPSRVSHPRASPS